MAEELPRQNRTKRRPRIYVPLNHEPEDTGLIAIDKPAQIAPEPFLLNDVFRRLGGRGWFLERLGINIQWEAHERREIEVAHLPIGSDPEQYTARFTFERNTLLRCMIPRGWRNQRESKTRPTVETDCAFALAASSACQWMHERQFLPASFQLLSTICEQSDTCLWMPHGTEHTAEVCQYWIRIMPPPYDPHFPYSILLISKNFTVLSGVATYSPF